MKKLYFVALMVVVVAFTLAFAGQAFAVKGNSTYTDWTSEASAAANPPGSSPHYGYIATTKNCAVCHAVHNSGGGDVLLRSSAGQACTYCHITTNIGIQVYNGNSANYSADNIFNHSQGLAPCNGCHSVHSANTVMGGQYILKNLGWGGGGTASPASLGATSTVTALGLTGWCTACHPYYYTNHNSISHMMNTASTSFNNPNTTFSGAQVAWVDSTTCQSCHDGGTGAGALPAFPHYEGPGTTGMPAGGAPRFLRAGVANAGQTAVNNDGVCLACHKSGNMGVGTTF